MYFELIVSLVVSTGFLMSVVTYEFGSGGKLLCSTIRGNYHYDFIHIIIFFILMCHSVHFSIVPYICVYI